MLRKNLVKVAVACLIGLTAAVVMPTAASAADTYEKNNAVAGNLPSSVSAADCVQTEGAKVCFQSNSDTWWVKDTAADGASAEAMWSNWLDGQLDSEAYRSGSCRNTLGNGQWGYCNKNYYEGSSLRAQPAVWDRSAGVAVRFGPYKHFTA
jgi:hypothetical protein